MSGRYEHEQYLKTIAINSLKDYPVILMNYYEEAAGRQRTSKGVFVNRVKRFCDYLKLNGINIWDNSTWEKITKRDIKDYIKSIKTKVLKDGTVKELKGKSLDDVLMTLDNFFGYLVSEEYITKNPVPSKKEMSGIIPQETKEHTVVYLTPEEVNHVKNNIIQNSKFPKRDLCIFLLGCRTGLRAQALSEIDISDINFEEMKLLAVEKNKKIRTIYLDPDTMRLITECIEERGNSKQTDALFTKRYRGETVRISKSHIELLVKKNTADLKKHITPHKMRSTCITNTYNITGDIYSAARKAGHSNLSNTKLYIDTQDKDRDLAMKLAALF